MNDYERRVRIARLVATHWAEAAVARGDEPHVPWRTMAHPLACVREALDGEMRPEELGVEEGPTADAIREVARA